MAKVTCAISGIRFNTNFLDSLRLPANEGFPHPIFAAPKKYLETLYSHYCRANLNSTDSYLLFMALLHSSDSIQWQHPATLDPQAPTTKSLIANNIKQLMSVLTKTDEILHPSFEQPKFIVSYETAKLGQIKNWIKAWERNIAIFYTNTANQHDIDKLNRAEAKLSKLILSEANPKEYTAEIADWASRAGEFPKEKDTQWRSIIQACFDSHKMFNIALTDIKQLKDHCEANIEVGSIHFHTLHKVLVEGISRHVDFLGNAKLATKFDLLPPSSDQRPQLTPLGSIGGSIGGTATTAKVNADAPVSTDYPDTISFIRAKLAYKAAMLAATNDTTNQ